jgi:transposase
MKGMIEVSPMIPQLEAVYLVSYLNIVNDIMLELNIPQIINKMVSHNRQCIVKPGEIVQLIVLDILTGRQALVHLEEWARHIDIKKLISPDVEASNFNDDTIARHLDRIHKTKIREIFSEITLQLWRQEGEGGSLHVFHSDTTSKSVYGAYSSDQSSEEGREEAEDLLHITEGYSRDRQGSKQFQYGMIVDKNGIAIHADVHDGNISDKTWNVEVLSKLDAQLAKLNLKEFIYVADAAAMSQKTMDEVKKAGGFLITRGSQNLNIVKEVLALVENQEDQWSEPWSIQKTGSHSVYRVQETTSTYYDHLVRLIVVESSALGKKKRHTLEKKYEAEQKQLEKAQKVCTNLLFHCKEDAEKERDRWEKELPHEFHTVNMQMEEVQIPVPKRGRGRPKNTETRSEMARYRVVINFSKKDEEHFKQRYVKDLALY